MKIDLKKILKSSLLVLLILLNCGWAPASVNSGADLPTMEHHSSCDEDIKNLGITSKEYAEYDYSLILLAEVSSQYLICYMYDKYENFNYNQIDFEYATASSETSLSLVKTKQIRRDVEVLSTSTDGLIKKILVKNFVIPNGIYRKYVVNQLTSSDYEQNTDNDERYLSLAIGTEYIYTTNSDGLLSYHVKAINYVTIENQVVYHYNIKFDNTYLNGWRWTENNTGSVGSRYGMLGFSAKKLKIEKLQEVEVIYDVYDYSCFVPQDDTQLPNIYNEKNIKRLKENNPKYTNATDLSYLPEYGEKRTLVKKDAVEVVEPKIIKNDQFNDDNIWGKKVKNLVWDSIFEYKDIDKYFPEKDYSITNADMKDKFKDDEYIITVFKSDEKFEYNKNYHGYKFTKYSYEETLGQKLANDFFRFLSRCDTPSRLAATGTISDLYNYYFFESQEISNACVVRLKYLDEFNTPHDVKVISSPVDSSGNIAGGDQTDPDKNSWDEFLEMLMMIIIIVIIIFALYILFPVIAPFIPIIIGGITNGLKLLVSWIVKGISVVVSYIKIGVYKIGEFISSIFHR